MTKSLCRLLIQVNLALVAIFHITHMSFNANRENKILTKISESTVALQLTRIIKFMGGSREGTGGLDSPAIGFLRNTGMDPPREAIGPYTLGPIASQWRFVHLLKRMVSPVLTYR